MTGLPSDAIGVRAHRRRIAAALCCLTLATTFGDAWGHAFAQSYLLSVPFTYYAYGATAALAASFLVIGLFARGRRTATWLWAGDAPGEGAAGVDVVAAHGMACAKAAARWMDPASRWIAQGKAPWFQRRRVHSLHIVVDCVRRPAFDIAVGAVLLRIRLQCLRGHAAGHDEAAVRHWRVGVRVVAVDFSRLVTLPVSGAAARRRHDVQVVREHDHFHK